MKKRKYISILLLMLISISCKNEKHDEEMDTEMRLVLKTDTLEAGIEGTYPNKKEQLIVSKYNSEYPEIENIKRPEKTIIKNLEIDTTEAFGIWTQYPNEPHADFWLNSESFFIVDYDGDGAMPYILDKNSITIFSDDFVQTGIIISTKNDTLKIKWSDLDKETIYVKFEN